MSVLADRYASNEMRKIFSPESKIIAERKLWVALARAQAKKISDLPKNAQEYINFLEKISGAPMSAIGVGPGRDQTIVVKDFI